MNHWPSVFFARKSRFGLFIASLSLVVLNLVVIPSANAALTIGSNTGNYVSSTGGGSLASAQCSSNGVLSGIGGQTTNFNTYGATLTQVTGACATLNTDAQTIASVADAALGPYGSTVDTALTGAACGSANGNQVIVGARLYKTATGGYAAGVKLKCGTLPLGTSRVDGASLGTTTGSSYEDIACATGSVATGLYIYAGGILDKFGISCAAILTIPQTITLSLGGTTSKTYPYSQALTMSTSGSNGSGSVTYAIASGGTASTCALSSNASTATITAASSGTCNIAATIASDTNYVAATSASVAFTFNKAGQASLTITSTSGTYGTDLTLTTSGGTGTGTVSYSVTAGTTTCTVNTNLLTAAGSGTCSVTATKATDTNYSVISSSATVITFSQGTSTVNLTIPAGSIIYRQAKTLTAVASVAGKITFKANNLLISGCRNLAATSGNSYTVTCNYKTAVHGALKISATFVPTNTGYAGASAMSPVYITTARSNTR